MWLSPSPPLVTASTLGGAYPYTSELLALEGLQVPGSTPQPRSFAPAHQWAPYLNSHPDKLYARFLDRGLTYGFRIGFDRSKPLKPARQNLPSVKANSSAVNRYIEDEVALGKLRHTPQSSVSHISPIGILPKRNQPGKYRLIVDLSSPSGFSINDRIDPTLCSLKYASVAQAAEMVRQQGKGALMAKLDLKAAYRMVPVHPEDQPLLGIEWKGETFMDLALPFGLRLAPKIFTAIADRLAWALSMEGVHFSLHYLDDFFFCSTAGSLDCARALDVAIPLCDRLGFPVAPNNVKGPTTSIVFLGILIDSVKFTLSLPQDKLSRLKATISSWQSRRSASKHQLQQLLGHLNHAATVVRPGRSFLRALIEASKHPRHPTH